MIRCADAHVWARGNWDRALSAPLQGSAETGAGARLMFAGSATAALEKPVHPERFAARRAAMPPQQSPRLST